MKIGENIYLKHNKKELFKIAEISYAEGSGFCYGIKRFKNNDIYFYNKESFLTIEDIRKEKLNKLNEDR